MNIPYTRPTLQSNRPTPLRSSLTRALTCGTTAYVVISGLILGTLLHFFVSSVPAIAYAVVASRLQVVNRLAGL